MSQLALYLLGAPRVELDGEQIHIGRTKAVALLAYLAVTAASHRRDALATLLWPEYDQSRARADLRRTLSLLNRRLGQGWLVADRETVDLSGSKKPDRSLWLDVDQFRRRLAECDAHARGLDVGDVCADCVPLLAEAVELYRDDFLSGFTLRDSLAFDEWQFFQTERLKDQLASALDRLVRWYSERDEYDRAIAHARRRLEHDILNEAAHRGLMELYALAGQKTAALRQYHLCQQTLAEELGVPPSQETTALYERIRAGEEIGRESQVVTPVPHNLPPQTTPIIGRERELAELDQLISDPELRLVTVVGPGGIGKTRLALALAERQLGTQYQPAGSPVYRSTESPDSRVPRPPRFPHGVFFVPLARLSEADQIVPSVAEALGFNFGGAERESRTIKQQLLDYLREKRLLLILDNFEHLLEGVDLVVDILHTAPQAQVLVTSRERLHLREEQTFAIQGLEYGDGDALDDPARPVDGTEYAAAQLFLQTARRVQSDLKLAGDDATALARICRLVDGIPLAIELAAGWVDVLSLADVAAEIQRGLDSLETKWRDVPARHRSMRAVFDSSWRGLDPSAQDGFVQLCVFRGGFTRAAAGEVAGADLRTLARLVDKSLLQFNRARERYDIHELLRQYGTDKLAEDPERRSAVRSRHSAFYCAALKAWEVGLKGARQRAALAEIDADLENVRSAWLWAATRNQVDRLDQAIDAFGLYRELRWLHQDGETTLAVAQEQLEAYLAQTPEVTVETLHAQRVLAKMLLWRFRFCRYLGLWESANALLEQTQALLNSPGMADQDMRAERACFSRHKGRAAGADLEKARRHYEESASLYRAAGDQWYAAWSVVEVGRAYQKLGNYDQARRLLEESLAYFRAAGCLGAVSEVLDFLGFWARDKNEPERARRYFDESLAVAQSDGSRTRIAYALGSLAFLALFQGRFKAAAVYLRDSIAIFRVLGLRAAVVVHSSNLAAAYWLSGEFGRAYETIGEALVVSRELDTSRDPAFASAFRAWLDAAVGSYTEAR